ncbi:Rhs element Vgr family protein [Striga asiatica]|uniref:Rhs element Vgr family protein n=1 Tax=Striga asiatica TaxID=4170 RepID=A0A5A7PNI9_STRAF|nr:Rhs element Vgr family protein [Striga asiatica]
MFKRIQHFLVNHVDIHFQYFKPELLKSGNYLHNTARSPARNRLEQQVRAAEFHLNLSHSRFRAGHELINTVINRRSRGIARRKLDRAREARGLQIVQPGLIRAAWLRGPRAQWGLPRAYDGPRAQDVYIGFPLLFGLERLVNLLQLVYVVDYTADNRRLVALGKTKSVTTF